MTYPHHNINVELARFLLVVISCNRKGKTMLFAYIARRKYVKAQSARVEVIREQISNLLKSEEICLKGFKPNVTVTIKLPKAVAQKVLTGLSKEMASINKKLS